MLGLILVSCILLVVEIATPLLTPVRSMLGNVVAPLHFLAALPNSIAGGIVESVRSRSEVLGRNAELERELLSMQGAMSRYEAILNENARLRELLESGAHLRHDILLAELISTSAAPIEIVLDKGSLSGVRVGQAVIDATGLFGQVIETSAFTSRVLLITDPTHAVPVRVLRNDVRSIAAGDKRGRLALKDTSVTIDIVEGDRLVTSGLGDRFPADYPVGVVESVNRDPTEPFAEIVVRPYASLDTSRQVLVISAAAPSAALDQVGPPTDFDNWQGSRPP